MKPINYILSLASVCVLFACGNEDTPKEILPSVIEPDATISLLVNTGEKAQLKSFTKADAPTIDDNKIARLTVAVFNAGAYDGHTMGALEVLKTETAKGDQPITQVEDIEVKSGPVKVLVLANLPESLLSKFTIQGGTFTIDDFIGKGAETTVLSDEVNVTASSEVYDIDALRGKINCLGYKTEEVAEKTNAVSVSPIALGENAIPLYRNVSRVLLNKIKFEPKEQYFAASLEIKGIYVANVKSKSYLASKANGRGSVEVADIAEDNFYWCGAFDEEIGSLKEGNARKMSDLLLYTPESSMILDSEKKQVDGDPIGKPFYIYQNQAGKNHTLLIVYGTFKYKLNASDDEYQEQQSFYTVIVNEPGKGVFEPGAEEHEYVTRNFNYNIELTISGSGSTEPYDKAISSNLSTSVKVLPWNVKIIHEDVE